MSEDLIQDFAKNSDFSVMILRYFNVIGSDPKGRLGEAPRPELRKHARISGACFDAAMGIIPGIQVCTLRICKEFISGLVKSFACSDELRLFSYKNMSFTNIFFKLLFCVIDRGVRNILSRKSACSLGKGK